MQRLRIIHRRRHASFAQVCCEAVAVVGFDNVLSPGADAARDHLWRLHEAFEHVGVAIGNFVTRADFVGEDGELFDQDRGLDRVEA